MLPEIRRQDVQLKPTSRKAATALHGSRAGCFFLHFAYHSALSPVWARGDLSRSIVVAAWATGADSKPGRQRDNLAEGGSPPRNSRKVLDIGPAARTVALID